MTTSRSSSPFLFLTTLFVLGLRSTTASAQETTSYQELSQAIKAPHAMAQIGTDLFGDRINLYNGKLEFIQTDVSLPGNNALPVMSGRRLATGIDNRGGRPFGLWDLDIPHLHGMFSYKDGWRAIYGMPRGSRCSNFGAPPTVLGLNNEGAWNPDEFWQGSFLYIPGIGDQQMLRRLPANTVAPGPIENYPVVTAKFWSIGCLPALANDPAQGEGFLAIAPDGTRYQFDQIISYPARGLSKSVNMAEVKVPTPDATTSYRLQRKEVWILPTKVADRFGNVVTYTYDPANPANLMSISSSDGRKLTFSYGSTVPNNAGGITGISDGTRSWTYTYRDTNGSVSLDVVVLPDGSSWKFADAEGMQKIEGLAADVRSGEPTCDAPELKSLPVTGTMVHPSGATGSFTLTATLHGRSDVHKSCTTDGRYWYPQVPKFFYTYSLTDKSITGPGLQQMAWHYAYSDADTDASWAPCNGCKTDKTVSVTDPTGARTLYTFGNRYNLSEGRLQQVDTSLRRTTTDYRAPGAGPYPNAAGVADWSETGDSDQLARYMPVERTTTIQQGETFTWQVDGWDTTIALPRPVKVTRSNTLGYHRTETTAFDDNLSKYVLGQIESLTEESTGQEVVRNTYDGDANLKTVRKFGHLEQTLDYYVDGTVKTRADGLNQMTRYANYARGIAQVVTHADGSVETAKVNNIGGLDWTTDQNTYTTAYYYDAMGRLARIEYPVEDSGKKWNPTEVSTYQSKTTELGLEPGHWRQQVKNGDAHTVTYYDALWRPVYTERWDNGDVAGTYRVVKFAHDFAGRKTFESYPQRSVQAIDGGVYTSYDILGRTTATATTSELGSLFTSYFYLDGFRKAIRTPRAQAVTDGSADTTYGYQAFDAPSENAIVNIAAPHQVKVSIARDVFGKPLAITRGDDNQNVTRRYLYDGFQRLCKTIEPETGATVQDYDAANNVRWRATGLSLTSPDRCDTGQVAAANKVSFTYDALNQLKTTEYGDGSPAIIRRYTLDGLLDTVSSNGAVWTNTYNKRRLNERESLVYGGKTYDIGRQYDANGSLAQLKYPAESLTLDYQPNALGEPRQIGSYAKGIAYHPNGAVAAFTYGNGLTHRMTQNARGLAEQTTDGGVIDDRYRYDENGNVAGIDDLLGNAGRGMEYDRLDRLTGVAAPGIWGQAGFAYDTLDNLTSTTITTGGTARSTVHHYDERNRLSSIGNGPPGYNFAYDYDAQGNIIKRGGQAYAFDLGNRMKSAAGRATYGYDGLGHRVSVIGTDGVNRVQVYSQAGQLLYVVPSNGTATKYVYLHHHVLAEVNGANVTYEHTDGLGSPVAQTDANKAVISRTRYEPYGYIASGSARTIGFTGHVNDSDTGLIYMQQRYYDPVAGRMLSIDPVTTDANAGTSFNRYSYANNNPYKFIDPDGRFGRADCAAMGGNCTYIDMTSSSAAHDHNNPSYNPNIDFQPYAQAMGSALERLLNIYMMAVMAIAPEAAAVERGAVAVAAAKSILPSAGGLVRQFEQVGDKVYYRVFSGDANVGGWLTAVAPRSSAWAQEALALPPSNTAKMIQEVLVPNGTLLERSRAMPMPEWGRMRGGAEQFKLLEEIPIRNFGPGSPLP